MDNSRSTKISVGMFYQIRSDICRKEKQGLFCQPKYWAISYYVDIVHLYIQILSFRRSSASFFSCRKDQSYFVYIFYFECFTYSGLLTE